MSLSLFLPVTYRSGDTQGCGDLRQVNGKPSFDLNIIDDLEIDDASSATITAQVSNWIPGSAEISVLDNESKEIFVTLSSVVGEGAGQLKEAGTVRLSGTSTSDLTIDLFSSDTTEIAVPATVIVPKNTNLVKFDLTIMDDAEIDGPQTVSIAARAIGFTNGTATLTINDNETPPMTVAPHPPHLSTNNSPSVDLSWNTGEGEILINGDFETGRFLGLDKSEHRQRRFRHQRRHGGSGRAG